MKLNQEQIEAIRAAVPELAEQLESGEKVTVEREVKRWTPKPFLYDQSIGSIESAHCRKLLAYREEFAPGYVVPEIGVESWAVWRDCDAWSCGRYISSRVIGAVYMPEDVARELCRKLNSGEVVL